MKGGIMRNDILELKGDILQWIAEHKSKSFICKKLKCKPETLNRYLGLMNIVYDGNKSGVGIQKKRKDYIPLEEYLKYSNDVQTNKVRIKLLKEGYKKYECENCHLSVWLGQPIPLEVHHIDGDRSNNKICNFQLLCPNCHALTDTYRGKNSRKTL